MDPTETGETQAKEARALERVKPIYANIVVRVIGTLIGFAGLGLLYVTTNLVPSLYRGDESAEIGTEVIVLSVALFVVFTSYFLFCGYAVWFKLSPTTVRHVFAVGAFLLWSSATKWITPYFPEAILAQDMIYQGIDPNLVSILLVFIVYRIVSSFFIRSMFPQSSPAALN